MLVKKRSLPFLCAYPGSRILQGGIAVLSHTTPQRESRPLYDGPYRVAAKHWPGGISAGPLLGREEVIRVGVGVKKEGRDPGWDRKAYIVRRRRVQLSVLCCDGMGIRSPPLG